MLKTFGYSHDDLLRIPNSNLDATLQTAKRLDAELRELDRSKRFFASRIPEEIKPLSEQKLASRRLKIKALERKWMVGSSLVFIVALSLWFWSVS